MGVQSLAEAGTRGFQWEFNWSSIPCRRIDSTIFNITIQ